MATVDNIGNAPRLHGFATILAIGTATPPNCFIQARYPDYYFRVTNCEHMTHLKQKFNQLTNLLGLQPSVKRLMIYEQGCAAGGTVLRLAKDLAENNKGARVLVVCSEITAIIFRGPSETHVDSRAVRALFGDGAAAIIVGADPDASAAESPIFQLVSAAQTVLPDSEKSLKLHLREAGLTFHLQKDVPDIIAKNIEKCLVDFTATRSTMELLVTSITTEARLRVNYGVKYGHGGG